MRWAGHRLGGVGGSRGESAGLQNREGQNSQIAKSKIPLARSHSPDSRAAKPFTRSGISTVELLTVGPGPGELAAWYSARARRVTFAVARTARTLLPHEQRVQVGRAPCVSELLEQRCQRWQ